MQLGEIAETVLFQEWSELKNNQRLDFFVLLYQDKRTKKTASDVYRTRIFYNFQNRLKPYE
jgi:hypothetical protein